MDKPSWADEVYTPPKYTKYCFVPHCKNDSSKTPNKHFFHIPHRNKEEWCRAVGKAVIPKRPLVICEDHLDLEYDLENYETWKTSENKNARLRPRVPFLKKISEHSEPSETMSSITEDEPGPSRMPKERCIRPNVEDKSVTCTPNTAIKSIQVKPVMVNCGINCNLFPKRKKPVSNDKASNEFQPSGMGSTSELSESEASYEPSTTTSSATHRIILNGRIFMLNLVEQKPFQYIGIPKKLYWVIDSLCNAHKNITKLEVHSVINNKCTAFLDNAVIIACGAINVQSPIIKRE